MVWKERESFNSEDTWGSKDSLKDGDVIEGVLVDIQDNANATPDKPLSDFVLDTGQKKIRVWGSAILQRKITEKDFKKKVRITYQGTIKVAQGRAKDFKVEVDEP